MIKQRHILRLLMLYVILGTWKGYLALYQPGQMEPRQIFPVKAASAKTTIEFCNLDADDTCNYCTIVFSVCNNVTFAFYVNDTICVAVVGVVSSAIIVIVKCCKPC